MGGPLGKGVASGNRLLSSLTRRDYETLEPHLRFLQLSAGHILHESHSPVSHCYFLETTVVSLTSLTEKGSSVAVGIEYAGAMFMQVVQTSACNRFHNTLQRLIRFLLIVQDRLNVDRLPFTHESLAEALGTDRASVTRAARGLNAGGLIDYGRGQVAILDRTGLESAACECYGVIKTAYSDLLTLRLSASA